MLPECAAQIENEVLFDFLNEDRQDRLWNERQNQRKQTPTASVPVPSNPVSPVPVRKRRTPLSPPTSTRTYTSHSFHEEQEGAAQWDAEYIKSIVESHPVTSPGQRHRVLLRLLTAIKRSCGRINTHQLHSVHEAWFTKFRSFMSGSTSSQQSWSECLSVWSWLWATDDPRRTADFFGSLDIASHPGRDLIPIGCRYDRYRELSDFMYTASRNVSFADDRFFMGIKEVQRVLRLNGINSAWRTVRALKLLGLIVETIPGNQQTRKAAFYSIPQRWRNASVNSDGSPGTLECSEPRL